MEENTGLEPGCFGISVCFEPQSKTCGSCAFKIACRDKGKAEALLVNQRVLANDLLRRFNDSTVTATLPVASAVERRVRSATPRAELTVEQQQLVASLPKKPGEVVQSLLTTRTDVSAFLDNGIDPFRDKGRHAYLSVTCKLLMEGGFTRPQLIESFQTQLNWGYQTASSYATIAITALKALNVITGDKKLIRKKP